MCKTNHRLIWMVANGCDIPEGYDVHHIDGNKLNNSINNLELVNRFEHNSYHKSGERSPLYGKHQTEEHKKKISNSNKNNPKLSKEVIQYTLDGKLVKVWDSTMEAERNGFEHNCINRCCKGKAITHKGFKWKYKDEIELQN